jgi:hypothetical protein
MQTLQKHKPTSKQLEQLELSPEFSKLIELTLPAFFIQYLGPDELIDALLKCEPYEPCGEFAPFLKINEPGMLDELRIWQFRERRELKLILHHLNIDKPDDGLPSGLVIMF